MNPPHLLPLLTTIVVFLTLISSSSSDTNLIQAICQKTHYVDLCFSTLSTDETAVKCQVIDCVARVAVIHAIKNASDAHTLALHMAQNGPPPEQVRPLRSCSEIYVNVMSYLGSSLGFVEQLDYKGAEVPLKTAGTQAAGCEKGFTSHPSPMSQTNEMFQEMLIIALMIVDILTTSS